MRRECRRCGRESVTGWLCVGCRRGCHVWDGEWRARQECRFCGLVREVRRAYVREAGRGSRWVTYYGGALVRAPACAVPF